jgi:putative flippase GtrA
MIQRAAEFARFCVVGILCFGVGLAVLSGGVELAGLHYLIAYAASFVAANCVGYLLNGRFTFGKRTSLEGGGISRYMLVNGTLLIVNSCLLRLLVETCHVWYVGATALLAIVNMPVSFIAHRLFSYRLGLTGPRAPT